MDSSVFWICSAVLGFRDLNGETQSWVGIVGVVLCPFCHPLHSSRLEKETSEGRRGLVKLPEAGAAASGRYHAHSFSHSTFSILWHFFPFHTHLMALLPFTENVEATRRECPQASAKPSHQLLPNPPTHIDLYPALSFPSPSYRWVFSAPVPPYPLKSTVLLIVGILLPHEFSLFRGTCGVGVDWKLIGSEGLQAGTKKQWSLSDWPWSKRVERPYQGTRDSKKVTGLVAWRPQKVNGLMDPEFERMWAVSLGGGSQRLTAGYCGNRGVFLVWWVIIGVIGWRLVD